MQVLKIEGEQELPQAIQRARKMNLVNCILQYFGEMPPPYNPFCDLNRDGFINVLDLLLALAK
jgi:hypothetical protein